MSKLMVNECVSVFVPVFTPQEEGVEVASFREVVDCVSDGELADCGSVSVSLSDLVSVSVFLLVSLT